MWTIASRELRSFFLSPLAWVILGVVQFILAWVFAGLMSWFLQPELHSQLANHPEAPGVTDLVVSNLFDWMGIVLLLLTPLLTMRLTFRSTTTGGPPGAPGWESFTMSITSDGFIETAFFSPS